WPVWSEFYGRNGSVSDAIKNANVSVFFDVLRAAQVPLPDYFEASSQKVDRFLNLAVSEAIAIPVPSDPDNYSIAISNEKFRYVMKGQISPQRSYVKKIDKECLFYSKTNDGVYDETEECQE